MTARVLVVDDILANVKLLEARLSAEYFDVLTAFSGAEALTILESERVDVVLLDVMMPGLDGFEVCRRIKASPRTAHVPVVIVTALDQPADKVQGLEAGADDFLTKPVDDIALVTRVKNLARSKTVADELALRAATSVQLGALPGAKPGLAGDGGGSILLIEDHERAAERLVKVLGKRHAIDVRADPQAALLNLAEKSYDLVIVSLSLARSDGLRLCGQVRSLERTRYLPILVLVDPGDNARLLRALDIGVNDYLARPVDRNELMARVRTQIRRKRHSDDLRNRLRESVELSVTDPLTGLYNRRYLDAHLHTLAREAASNGRPLSLLLADIDHFKSVNDSFGHDAGDRVLKQVADRLRRHTRAADLACRLGGEEFVIVMPDATRDGAFRMGERLRASIAGEPFGIDGGTQINVTTSVGIATFDGRDDTLETLLKRADDALYAAKREGRNKVVYDAA
ncbi:MAG TPA: PleD family two-component system response regulator [Hyphomicrobiaceae bacterium]|jgi:two-component system cell cycle response regulator|nr:PleD family two-component system response regulator [Hyphomicrobiaceae bacterium]